MDANNIYDVHVYKTHKSGTKETEKRFYCWHKALAYARKNRNVSQRISKVEVEIVGAYNQLCFYESQQSADGADWEEEYTVHLGG